MKSEINHFVDAVAEDTVGDHVIHGPVSGMRTLSGIQPSGQLHLGNYFGAIAQHLDAQHRNEAFFFVASYHAMTSARRGSDLRISTRDVALDYLALGIDPMRAALYRQADVAGVTQLAWILNCLCSIGDLERSVSYKDKLAKGLAANAGLFTYPVLMAADILIVNAQVVPVGQDQIQNIELARRLASRFNEMYEQEVFQLPKAQCNESALLPGKDGAKMSKSYGNTIPIFCEAEEYRSHAMGIVTDSASVADVKQSATCNAFRLLRFLVDTQELAQWESRYSDGGLRYSDVKNRIGTLLEERFGPAREARAKLAARPNDVEDILRDGAQRANVTAEPVLAQIFDVTGIGSRAAFVPASGPTFSRSDRGWS
jgi:tryptophanyl-tRNA synthetase